MKRCIIKTLSFLIAAAIIIAVVPKFSDTVSAATKGSQSCSTSSQNGVAKASMSLNGASNTSGTTATYIVDKYYYPTMSDFGSVYSVTFEGTGMYANTNISASGDFSISNTGTRTDHPINIQENTYACETHSGTLVGSVPEPGQTASVTLTANCRINYNVPGYFNGLAVFEASTSVSMTAVVIGVDSTELQELLLKYSDYKQSCWTQSSWSAFSTAYNNAKSVATSATALQSDIDSAYDALLQASSGLVHDGNITECEYCLSGSVGNPEKTVASFYDVSYGNSNMDVFLPDKAEGDVALLLFIHGGAWIGGDKSEFTSKAYDACSKYGIISATVNYRFADCFNITGWNILDDIQSAVTMIKSMAADRGLNIVKMMTAGHSAGGHLSLMYAYTRQETSPVRPVCVWDMSGPTTLYNSEYLKEDGLVMALSAVCGQYFTADQAAYAFVALENMSPTKYVGSALPTLICHGVQDGIVPYSDGVALNSALDNAGVTHTFITFPNSNHGLESDPDCYNQMMSEYDRYVRTYLLPGGVPDVVHSYASETIPKTCTTDGYTLYTCVDCGRYYVSDIEKASHELVVENGHPATCTQPGLTDGAFCSVCNAVIATQTVIPATGHTVVNQEAVAPTCKQNGLTKGSYCSVCGEVFEAQQTIAATGHNVVNDAAVSPTCTTTGKTAGTHCSTCGEVFVAQQTIAATGHTPGATVRENETASTCLTNGGYDDVVYCTVCSAELSREHTSFAKTSHKVGAWEITVPATYTTEGTQVKRCTVCGVTINTKKVPVLEPEFAPAQNSDLRFDGELLKNIPQGVNDLSEYLFLGGCTIETDSDIIATGSTVTVKSLLGTTLATYTAVVGGDVTSDGYVDAFDLALAGEYINTFTEPENEAYMSAVDMFEDGYLDATDLAYLIYVANFEE